MLALVLVRTTNHKMRGLLERIMAMLSRVLLLNGQESRPTLCLTSDEDCALEGALPKTCSRQARERHHVSSAI